MKKVLFIVANVGFQDYEFSVPYEVMKNAGYEVEIASGWGGKCRGVFMKSIEDSKKIIEVDPTRYDLLVFVGGGGAYDQYYKNSDYLELAKKAKSIAAICIAPTLLSDSGLFVGKQVTGRDDGF